LIAQLAVILKVDKDVLCLAAGTISEDVRNFAATHPEQAEEAFKAFRKKVKK